jgi:hypothetical protein
MKREDKVAKRKKKLAKRQRKLRLKSVRAGPVETMPKNPYLNAESAEEDIDLLQHAWEMHFGELPDDFIPPLFCQDEEGLKMEAWGETFRDLMLKKYETMELVEPRFRFLLALVFSESTINPS